MENIDYGQYIVNLRNVEFDKTLHIRADRLSMFGNPFVMKRETERDLVCDQYDVYFVDKINKNVGFKYAIQNVGDVMRNGKKLACWCYPKRCHCMTIVDYLITNGIISIKVVK